MSGIRGPATIRRKLSMVREILRGIARGVVESWRFAEVSALPDGAHTHTARICLWEETCTVPTTTGYEFGSESGTKTISGFAPSGVTCKAPAYTGTVTYTVCGSAGQPYSVQGCQACQTINPIGPLNKKQGPLEPYRAFWSASGPHGAPLAHRKPRGRRLTFAAEGSL